jgi:hypothetical protein
MTTNKTAALRVLKFISDFFENVVQDYFYQGQGLTILEKYFFLEANSNVNMLRHSNL